LICILSTKRFFDPPSPPAATADKGFTTLWLIPIPRLWYLKKLWRMKEKYIIRDFQPFVFFFLLGFVFRLATVALFIRLFIIWIIAGHIPPTNALAAMFSFISANLFTLFATWFEMEANKDLK